MDLGAVADHLSVISAAIALVALLSLGAAGWVLYFVLFRLAEPDADADADR